MQCKNRRDENEAHLSREDIRKIDTLEREFLMMRMTHSIFDFIALKKLSYLDNLA